MRHLILHSMAVLAALVFAGCGGGGAAEVPTITVKPADKTPNSSDGTTDGSGTTPENGGGTEKKDGYGTFKGKVVLTGAAPTLAPLVTKPAPRDPAVCAATAPIPDQSIVSSEGGLGNVFIYLKKAPKNGKDTIGDVSDTLEFDQKGCIFIPHAMIARTGKTIVVKNSDPVPHNVKTKPAVGQAYEATLNQGQTGELVFKSSEPVPVAVECNFHTWMKAYQLPLDHPYAVITKPDGSFEIPDLPVGTHQFVIWQERSTRPLNARFTVKIKSDGDIVEETIEIESAKLAEVGGAKTKTIKLTFNR